MRTELLLVLIVYTLIFAFERYFSCLINPDVLIASFRSQDRINKIIEKSPSERPKLTPVENFHRLFWKVKLILRIKKVKKGEGLIDPSRNPLTKKLYLTLVLWAFVCILVYFVFPIIGNRDTRVNGFMKVLCNDYYAEREIQLEINRCHTLWKGVPIYWIFFLLNIMYVYFSALQIRYGFNHSRESVVNQNWKSTIGYTKFKVYEALPLLREINTTIEFCAANTSLTYLEWLKLEDIRGAMVQAKYQAERRLVKVVGDAINSFVKICIGLSALFIVVLIIVSPMLLFSDLNPSQEADEVLRGKMNVDLIFEKMGNFSLLQDLHMVATREGLHNKQKLEFSNIMEQSVPFTPESINNAAELLKLAAPDANGTKTRLSSSSNIILRIKLDIVVSYNSQ